MHCTAPSRRTAPWGGATRLVLAVAVILAVTTALALVGTPRPAAAQDVFTQADPEAVPVVLVPGWSDEANTLEPLRIRFLDAGWSDTRVRIVGRDDPVGSNRAHAKEIARTVELLRSLTGADRVDVVAHSMGGLAVRHFLLHEGGADMVRRVVFLGTPHRGTLAAMLAWGEGGREMVPGSAFLNRLNEGPGLPDGVEALALRTPVDLRVIPGSSAVLPEAYNLEVCCPPHSQMVDDEEIFQVTAVFLREGPDELAGLERPGDRAEWSRGAFRAWNPWEELWAPSLMRRFLLPSGSTSGEGDGR